MTAETDRFGRTSRVDTWWAAPRHLIGGRLDCFTCDRRASGSYQLWRGSSWLNERHMAFAWFSLVWVAFTDVYIYLVSSGRIRDLNTW